MSKLKIFDQAEISKNDQQAITGGTVYVQVSGPCGEDTCFCLLNVNSGDAIFLKRVSGQYC